MKQFTAIYSTESLKNIEYSFKAADTEAAVDFCKFKFSTFPNITIVENTDENGHANEGRVVWNDRHNVL